MKKTLNEIINSGASLLFLDGDIDVKRKLPRGMAICCNRKNYEVYFQKDNSEEFEYIVSYPVSEFAESFEFEAILSGGIKLASKINSEPPFIGTE